MPERASIPITAFFLFASGLIASARAQDPSPSYEAEIEKAVALYGEGKDAEAAAALEGLTLATPDRKEGFLWLGHVRRRLKEWQAAEAAYRRYADLAPAEADGPLCLAGVYLEQGKTAPAKLWVNWALDREPDNVRVREDWHRVDAAQHRAATDGPAGVDPAAGTPDAPPPHASQRWRGYLEEWGLRGNIWRTALGVLLFGSIVVAMTYFIDMILATTHKRRDVRVLAGTLTFGVGLDQYLNAWGEPEGTWWIAVLAGAVVGAALVTRFAAPFVVRHIEKAR